MSLKLEVVFLLIACSVSVHTRYLDDTLLWKQSQASPCKPFTVFVEECNTCVCGADGVRSCTRNDCSVVFPRTDEEYDDI